MAKYSMPPRQKMINLLYVILIAMLAINISSDVLDGYRLLNADAAGRIEGLRSHGDSLLADMGAYVPDGQKAAMQALSDRTDRICSQVNDLKEEIAMHADKDKYRPGHLKAGDDLNAVPDVFLSVTSEKGRALHDSLLLFRSEAMSMIPDGKKRDYLSSFLRLDPLNDGMSWEKETFSYLPAIAGVVVLDKLTEDVLIIRNEVYSYAMDKGSEGKENEGRYVLINAGQKVVNEDGTVEGPVVLLTPSAAGVLYRQYENDLNIFCAGISMDELHFSVDNGRAFKRGDRCIVIPSDNARTASLRVSRMKEGKMVSLFNASYKVKSLPDPAPFITYRTDDGNIGEYRGNVPVEKENLKNIIGVDASVEDGPDINFNVTGFETVLIKSGTNKVLSVIAKGKRFNDEQKKLISGIESGDKLYITSIEVSGSGGVKKRIAPINVVIL